MIEIIFLAVFVLSVVYIVESLKKGVPIIQKVNNIILDGKTKKRTSQSFVVIVIILLSYAFLIGAFMIQINDKLNVLLKIFEN